jgi:hypothetical protein
VHERLVYHVLAGEQDSDHFLVPFDYAPSTRRIATLRETYRPRRMQAPSVLSKDGWMSFQNVALHPALVELEVDEAIGESFASEYGQRLLRTISMQCSSMLQVSDDFEQVRVLPESAWPGNLFGFLSAEQRCIVAATCSKMRTASVFDETYKNNAALGPWMDDSRVLESAWNLSTCITSDPPSPDTDPARAFRLIGGVRSYCLFYHRDRWMAHGEETEPENSLAHPSAMTNAWNALWERLHAFMLLRDAGRHSDRHVFDLIPAKSRPQNCCYIRCVLKEQDAHANVLVHACLTGPVARHIPSGCMPLHIRSNRSIALLPTPLPVYLTPSEDTIDGSVCFSLRITAAQPLHTLRIGFRQNSIFGRSYLLQLVMGDSGHGLLLVRDNARRINVSAGDDVFEPEPTPHTAPWHATDSFHDDRSACAIRHPPEPSAGQLFPSRVISLPPLRLGSIFTARYDAQHDCISFEQNGRVIPGASWSGVLRKHLLQPDQITQLPLHPEGQDTSVWLEEPVRKLHAFLPVLFLHSRHMEVECVSEDDARRQGECHDDDDDDDEMLLSSSSVLVSSSPRDCSAEFALQRSADEKAQHAAYIASGRADCELDLRMQNAPVPLAASSIPGVLRLFFHDRVISSALALPYLPISLIDMIEGYMHAAPPRTGSRGFKWMTYWASRMRDALAGRAQPPTRGDRLFASQWNRAGCTQLFSSTFPFDSKQALMGYSNDIYHDISFVRIFTCE